jgi:hypothetical protein
MAASFADFDSILRAAQREADIMNQSGEQIGKPPEPAAAAPPSEPAAASAPAPMSAEDKAKIQAQNMETIKHAMANANVPEILSKISNDPGSLGQMLDASQDMMTPELIEKARKLANGGQGGQILKEMQKRGVDTDTIRDQMADQQKLMREMIANKPHKEVILITASRQLRSKRILSDSIEASAKRFLKAETAVELPCSRLATGTLSGKTITVWYDPLQTGKNKRASKIVGFPVGGDILIVMSDGDLNEEQFLEAEKMLS